MHKEIIQLLNEKRLKEAFTQIKESANTLNNWELKSQVETQQTTYEYMLQYMAMGTQDPQRETIYNQLLCKGYELADKTYFLKDWEKAYGYFADKFRKFAQTPPHSFKEIGFMLEAAKHTSATPQNTEEEEAQKLQCYTLHKIQSMNCSIRYGYLHNGVKKTIRKPVNFYFLRLWPPTTKQ